MYRGLAALALVMTVGCARHEGKPGPQMVQASVKEIMEAIIDPSADILWDSVGTTVDKKGIHEKAPRSEAEWASLRLATVRLIESANLLMSRDRHVGAPGDKSRAPGLELEPSEADALIAANREVFDGFARALQTVDVEARTAIDTRDPKALFEAGGRMDQVCEACHSVFWYPNWHGPLPLPPPAGHK